MNILHKVRLPGRPLVKFSSGWLRLQMAVGLKKRGRVLRRSRVTRPPFMERWSRRVRSIRWSRVLNPVRWYKAIKTVPAMINGELLVGRAELSLVLIRKDKSRVDYGIVSRRKVTQAFVKFLAAKLADDFTVGSDSEYKYHASGTSSTAESNADAALGTEVETRSAGTQVDFSSGTTGNYRTVGTITYSGTFAIVEHGILSRTAAGILLDRSVFAAINVVSGDSIQFTYELTISPEA